MNKQNYCMLTKQIYDKSIALIDSGKTIDAIKYLRDYTESLKEAKRIVDVMRYCRDDISISDNDVTIPEINVFANTEKQKRDQAKVRLWWDDNYWE